MDNAPVAPGSNKAPLVCKVCNEKSFTQREGFFYCNECGTKQEQIRVLEADVEEFTDKGKVRHKILKSKPDTPQLTSWECYNYILRGLVEELLSLGAKEELKLTALQLWAAYLRKLEVAFFNKKQSVLPRLGVKFHKRDANIIYNQELKRRRKRKRSGSRASTIGSSEAFHALREHRRSKRNLDASIYTEHSGSSNPSSFSRSSGHSSSTSGVTARAIKLEFSKRARRYLKKKMTKKHLDKHAMDPDQDLTCHNLELTSKELETTDRSVCTMNMKQLYTILAIALNLIEDDIQLCDLVRFINENQVSEKKVFEYFPENIVPHVDKLLRDIKFYSYPVLFSVSLLREHAGILARFLNVKFFKTPNLANLASRYVTDLNLPPEIATCTERLINILTPQMKTRVPFVYPQYEARAMAYIVFVLKLLFGLDGYKEKLISENARKVNETLIHLDNSLKLFIWDDWVRFIEMRKVIISGYNSKYCRQYEQIPNKTHWIDELSEEFEFQNEQRKLADSGVAAKPDKDLYLMVDFFSKFKKKIDEESAVEQAELIKFPVTLMPSHLYFKRILMSQGKLIDIPDFMRVNHALREIEPYFYTKPLRKKLLHHKIKLKVKELPCTQNKEYLGIFRMPDQTDMWPTERVLKANVNISKEKWLQTIGTDHRVCDELEFKKELDVYAKNTMRMKKWRRSKLPNVALINSYDDFVNLNENNTTRMRKDSDVSNENHAALSMHSFNLFNENDMNPSNEINLPAPRRNLNTQSLFAGLSEDEDSEGDLFEDDLTEDTQTEDDLTEDDEASFSKESSKALNKLKLKISNMDYWILTGWSYGLYAQNKAKKALENKFPRSFSWLLQTCAQTLNVEWLVVYEQLLAIEMMFCYGIEGLDNYQDCVHFTYENSVKDICMLVNSFRQIW